MSLSSADIAKWSRRGDPIQAWYSFDMVRETLQSGPLATMPCRVFAQGSYANRTNIEADSDVDMVIALQSPFYPDKIKLSAKEQTEYAKYYARADRTWHDFREAVVQVLGQYYFLDAGSRAVRVRSNLVRLPADVLIALDHRYYMSFPSLEGQTYVRGVQFYASGTRKIVNYPQLHLDACAAKHHATGHNFRPVVRVAKNARNVLIADQKTDIEHGTAPSYYLESMFWNVEDDSFGGDIADAYRSAVSWLKNHSNEISKWRLPNNRGDLVGDAPDTAWKKSSAEAIIKALHAQLTAR
jgi:hypothetical protein